MIDELRARFAETVALGCPSRPEGWPPFALPAPLVATLAEAAARGACSPSTIDYYTKKMPSLLLEQLQPEDEARKLLARPIRAAPKLREALAELFRVLQEDGVDARALVGVSSPDALLRARPTVMALHAHALFGSGLPLLGAYPGEREVMARELTTREPDEVLDLRLSGNLMHELCHGQPGAGAPVWMVTEAAALTLGAFARRAHLFPDEPGEAVPGVSLFVCLGSALARRWGRPRLWRVLTGGTLEEAAGESRARALREAAWQDWLERREPPFVRDALSAMAWIKLAELAPEPGERLLERAAATPWSALAWWREEEFSVEELEEAVGALFQVNVLEGSFQTHPAELPSERIWIDVEACTISAESRTIGVFAEPAWWLLPPPMARRLWERGARRVKIDGARRNERRALAAALFELAQARGDLPKEVTWTFSR